MEQDVLDVDVHEGVSITPPRSGKVFALTKLVPLNPNP